MHFGGILPYKDLEKRRTYHREYMRRRRAAVKPAPSTVLNPAKEAPRTQAPPSKLDMTRPYREYPMPFPLPSYWWQDGALYDKQTLEFMGMDAAPLRRIDWNRPYTLEGRRHNSYLVQDGMRFDPQTGLMVGEGR